MQHSHLKSNRLDVFGDSMLNKLAARSRRQRNVRRARSVVRRGTFAVTTCWTNNMLPGVG